ncbi:uncharacterized protein FRV6_04702 [Fusarium oxysporum]|uniref:Uncharacterized protein n=1 Tax=Fusarium oxysporum TaxID=5507 RepID=A0A2H3SYZ7_FUSOX|nr:uncharacterized protein FRV6_04702 [Fusarium oxysporum]
MEWGAPARRTDITKYTSLLVIILSIDIILSKCFQDSLVQFSPYFLDVHKPQSGWHHQVPPILRPKNPPMRRCSDTYTGELKLKMLPSPICHGIEECSVILPRRYSKTLARLMVSGQLRYPFRNP